ncbi:uncharacterized protein LOC128041800 [Gossypium raimondii]|uniref:uncharacterized protein LOC128041800 n=1 Tax=Gossypium raimondii TaxID=29730 RepID=UPI00227B080A|nr:uncharacterized protein LOC128041800 [Gossypium raimondii]
MRMVLFIQENDLVVWDIIMDGPSVSSKQEGKLLVSKSKSEWNEEVKRSIQLNAKAMYILFFALGPDEYSRVLTCSNAKEIWNKLEVTHEGTSQVRKSKLGILTLNYETFKMKPREDIKEMSDRFTIITNEFKSYGKTYPNEEVVRKILQKLPIKWEAKVIAIENAKNLETLTLDELIGSLLTHDMRLNKGGEEEKVMKKNVGIALKSTTNEGSELSEEVDEDKELKMFARRFKSKKLGHIKYDCPQHKKKGSSKKKAYVAAWSDEDSSDDEVANLCILAINDTKVTSNSSTLNDYSFDELQDACDELGLKFEVVMSKHKKSVSNLRNENDLLSKNNHEL